MVSPMSDHLDQQTTRDQISWRAGRVPVSTRFDDPYYSLDDGLAEVDHVFLAGNALPQRFRPGFHIAELGFGTGLNCCAALRAWRMAGTTGPLRFTSFEAFPLAAETMDQALRAFPEARAVAGPMLDAWADGARHIESDDLILNVIEGDAQDTVPAWHGTADAWFLDGFSPAKNPELWTPELLAAVTERLTPGGTLATYTAAGHVRRALADAGLTVERRPGFGRKRHMTVAWR